MELHINYFFQKILPILNHLIKSMQQSELGVESRENISLSDRRQDHQKERMGQLEGEIRQMVIDYYRVAEAIQALQSGEFSIKQIS